MWNRLKEESWVMKENGKRWKERKNEKRRRWEQEGEEGGREQKKTGLWRAVCLLYVALYPPRGSDAYRVRVAIVHISVCMSG